MAPVECTFYGKSRDVSHLVDLRNRKELVALFDEFDKGKSRDVSHRVDLRNRKELVALFDKVDKGLREEGPELSIAITALHHSR